MSPQPAKPLTTLAQAFDPHRRRLAVASRAFTDACLAAASAPPADPPTVDVASPEMLDALGRWREALDAAFERVQRLPRATPGRSDARTALDTMKVALRQFEAALTSSDVEFFRNQMTLARRNLEIYHRRSEALERRLG